MWTWQHGYWIEGKLTFLIFWSLLQLMYNFLFLRLHLCGGEELVALPFCHPTHSKCFKIYQCNGIESNFRVWGASSGRVIKESLFEGMPSKTRTGSQKGSSHEKLWEGTAFLAMRITHAKAFKEGLAWCVHGISGGPACEMILFGSPLPISNIGG